MKRAIITILTAIALASIPFIVSAATCTPVVPPCPGTTGCFAEPAACPPAGTVCIPNPLKYYTFDCLVDSIMGFIFVLALALAPLMVLIGAFYLLTAGGDPKRVKTANSIFIWTAVGLLIVFLAKGLAAAIRAVLGLTP